jgi:hypothetical protein
MIDCNQPPGLNTSYCFKPILSGFDNDNNLFGRIYEYNTIRAHIQCI